MSVSPHRHIYRVCVWDTAADIRRNTEERKGEGGVRE